MKKVFLLVAVLLVVLIFQLADGASLSQNQKKNQEQMGADSKSQLVGDLLYVHSTNGRDGDSGADPRHPLATLVRAIALADAGDTIILNPGGSETVTSTITISDSNIRIICPAKNPYNGYTITGSGIIDLMTISGADVEIEGLTFEQTGATANQSCIITTATADRLKIKGCAFDASAITTTFTGSGVEITDTVQDFEITDCIFRDHLAGILWAVAIDTDQIGSTIKDCTFWVGQATAFGISANATGNGSITGVFIDGCQFLEADGDGSAATDAWDGTDGENAASGPISFAATTDQFLIVNCTAYTALSTDFNLIQGITSGAAGSIVNSFTGSGSALETKVDVIDGYHDVPTADAVTNAQMRDVIGIKTDTGFQVVADNLSIVRYSKGITDMLNGDVGVVAWAAGAAPANGVSIAEGLRYASEAVDALQVINLANAATIEGYVDTLEGSGLDNAATILTAVELGDTNQLANSATIEGYVDTLEGSGLDNAATILTAVELGDTNQLANSATILAANTVFECSFEADVDEDQGVYTGFVDLFTLTAPAGGLTDLVIYIDINKASTGWDTVSTIGDVLDMMVVIKIDGTNYRGVGFDATQVVGTGAGTQAVATAGIRFDIGALSAAAVLQVQIKMDTERGDSEQPCRIICKGGLPTIVPVAIP